MLNLLNSEYGWLVIMGICLIVGGLLLLFVAWVFTGEYERGGRDSVHRRPRELKPWHVEPTGERPAIPSTQASARHRLETTREATTNLGMYAARVAAARARIPVPITRQGERVTIDGDHAGTTGSVRFPQEEDEQEEGGEDRERREDKGRPLEDGEEGSGDAEAARTLTGWRYVPPTDRFVLLDSAGDIVSIVDAERWEFERGSVAKDLFVQGFPMIPEQVPYYEAKRRS